MHCLRQIFTIKEDSLVTQLLLCQIIHPSLKKAKTKAEQYFVKYRSAKP